MAGTHGNVAHLIVSFVDVVTFPDALFWREERLTFRTGNLRASEVTTSVVSTTVMKWSFIVGELFGET